MVTSAVIFDATFVGYNSIVLGTFGKVLLFFCPVPVITEDSDKQATLTQQTQCNTSNFESQESQIKEQELIYCFKKSRQKFNYELKREIPFKHSILGLSTSLISNNGALDLVVLTLNGISIWQYDPEKIIEIVNRKFEQNYLLDWNNLSFKKSCNMINESDTNV